MDKYANISPSHPVVLWKVLSDATRFRIVKLLLQAEWLYVCEIVDILSLPFYTISRHLKELKFSGLIQEKREGRFIQYFLVRRETPYEQKLLEIIEVFEDETTHTDSLALHKRLLLRKSNTCSLSHPLETPTISEKRRKKP